MAPSDLDDAAAGRRNGHAKALAHFDTDALEQLATAESEQRDNLAKDQEVSVYGINSLIKQAARER